MMDLERLTEALEPCCSGCSYDRHGHSDKSAIVNAARAYRDLLSSQPTDDEFDELTTVLAWVDFDAIYRQNGEWVSVDGDAKLVHPSYEPVLPAHNNQDADV